MRDFRQLYNSGTTTNHGYCSRNPYVLFSNHLRHVDIDSQQSFWRNYLAGGPFAAFPDVKPLPFETQPLTDASIGHLMPYHAPRIRPSVALYAAWSQLAALYSSTNDIVFGIASSGREIPALPQSWDIVGPMVATLPLRVRVPTDQDSSVRAFLEAVQRAVASTTPFEHSGLHEIRKASGDADVACRFHSLIIVQTDSPDAAGRGEFHEEPFVSEGDIGANVHPYPLVLEAKPREVMHKIELTAHFDSRLLDEATVQRLLQQLDHLVQEVARLGAADATMSQMDFLSPTDKSHIWSWNSDPGSVVPFRRCVHDLIAERTLLHPYSTAVCAWDLSLTYTELNDLSTRLAEQLGDLGIKTGDFVPICHEKSVWCVVAQLAVLKAGAACVSLDPSYPKCWLLLLLRAVECLALESCFWSFTDLPWL